MYNTKFYKHLNLKCAKKIEKKKKKNDRSCISILNRQATAALKIEALKNILLIMNLFLYTNTKKISAQYILLTYSIFYLLKNVVSNYKVKIEFRINTINNNIPI